MIPSIAQMGYIALTAFVINVIVAVIVTLVLNAMKVSNGRDETIKGDYFADAGDPRVERHLTDDVHLTTGTP
jgi:solute:Na+ symporter, SSS family